MDEAGQVLAAARATMTEDEEKRGTPYYLLLFSIDEMVEEVLAKDDRPTPATSPRHAVETGAAAPKYIAAWSYKRRQYGQTAEAVA